MSQSNAAEQQWIEELVQKLRPLMEGGGFPIETIRVSENKNNTSLWFRNSLILRVTIGKNSRMEVSETYIDIVERFCPGTPRKNSFCQIPISGPMDVPAEFVFSLIESAYVKSPREFDCCSRFEECSDARQCTNPNTEYALGCGYRRIMRTGKIFYGKNRNIDKP